MQPKQLAKTASAAEAPLPSATKGFNHHQQTTHASKPNPRHKPTWLDAPIYVTEHAPCPPSRAMPPLPITSNHSYTNAWHKAPGWWQQHVRTSSPGNPGHTSQRLPCTGWRDANHVCIGHTSHSALHQHHLPTTPQTKTQVLVPPHLPRWAVRTGHPGTGNDPGHSHNLVHPPQYMVQQLQRETVEQSRRLAQSTEPT